LIQQETAKIEAENFVQQQKIAVASEIKAVLDSWARYEQQLKENEQADLTKTVMEKVLASLKDEKTQREILTSALAEVERMSNFSFCFSS
jgi:F-type H+-transporting ATPase subunit b